MILKELDPFEGRSQEAIAARIAQDRMAYHLRRYFGKSEEIDVLNHLRVRSGGAMAHVEHLMLHPYGLLVVDRENLQGHVAIKDDGQWQRVQDDGSRTEMRSPITRAYLRALSLKALLDQNVKQKGFFDGLELDILVVVPDGARIDWPRQGPLVEVCFFEQVHERIKQRVMQCRHAASASGPLNAAERQRLAIFLRSLHRPAVRGQPQP